MNSESIFIVIKSLFQGNEVVYISTPINTGERYIKMVHRTGSIFKK
jgi:hypothetical protein